MTSYIAYPTVLPSVMLPVVDCDHIVQQKVEVYTRQDRSVYWQPACQSQHCGILWSWILLRKTCKVLHFIGNDLRNGASFALHQHSRLIGNRIWQIEQYHLRAPMTAESARNMACMSRYLSISWASCFSSLVVDEERMMPGCDQYFWVSSLLLNCRLGDRRSILPWKPVTLIPECSVPFLRLPSQPINTATTPKKNCSIIITYYAHYINTSLAFHRASKW